MPRLVPQAELLDAVPLLHGLPEAALEELAAGAEMRTFAPGARLVSELEPGSEALLVLGGEGTARVGGVGDEPPVEIGEVKTGDCVGEMALFTGELRSATIVARTPMTALVIDRARFEHLMSRHPTVGARFAATLAARLRDTEGVLAALLDSSRSEEERRATLRKSGGGRLVSERRLATALRVFWREGVAAHRHELPFLMFVSFVGSLIALRSGIWLDRKLVPGAMNLVLVLRSSYVAGLFLLCGSGFASLLMFRRTAQQRTAVLFGTGMALLFNSLPVLLTFDLFYRDIFTPDPNLTFSAEVLYRRTEGAYVITLIAALLLQAVYLRRFYRRTLTLLGLRARRIVGL